MRDLLSKYFVGLFFFYAPCPFAESEGRFQFKLLSLVSRVVVDRQLDVGGELLAADRTLDVGPVLRDRAVSRIARVRPFNFVFLQSVSLQQSPSVKRFVANEAEILFLQAPLF